MVHISHGDREQYIPMLKYCMARKLVHVALTPGLADLNHSFGKFTAVILVWGGLGTRLGN